MGKSRRIPAPICPYCAGSTALITGRDLYERRPDLAAKWFYICAPCEAWVGCHTGTRRPLGSPANAELRRARSLLHNLRLDPIWKGAIQSVGYDPEDRRAAAIITRTARSRVYAWLSHTMGTEVHAGQFTLEECRTAWVHLGNITYPEIREWAKARKLPKDQPNERPSV